MVLLLPDHNQMCQVCPNRNDCVKAIFSNLSDFRVASPLLPSPHASWKTNTNIRGARTISNRLPRTLTPLFACSTVVWWEIYSIMSEHREARQGLQYWQIATHLTFMHQHYWIYWSKCAMHLFTLCLSKSLMTFTRPRSIILAHFGQHNPSKRRDKYKKVDNLSEDTS